MADMDGLYHGPDGISRASVARPSRRPSTSVENCFIGASFLVELGGQVRDRARPRSNTMWGDDYPHAEGTWPHTRAGDAASRSATSIRSTRRQYLGDTAIDVYGLDRAKLEKVADRIGPTVAELATPCTPPEGRDRSVSTRSAPGRESSS